MSQQLPVLKVVTPAHTVKKSWEGKAYTVTTVSCLTRLVERDGTPFETTVKVRIDEDQASSLKVGTTYSLSPSSFYEKEGQLHFSPKFGAALAEVAQGADARRAA